MVVLCLGLLVAATGCNKYDKLVEANATCDEKWANIEAQLQRRYDLIPNLVKTIKEMKNFEPDAMAKLIAAKSAAQAIKMSGDDFSNVTKFNQFQQAQLALSRGMTVVQDAYPDLKTNDAFKSLMVQLESTENRLLRAREEYNAAVKTYNSELGKVSGQVVNKATGNPFQPRVFFSAQPEAQKGAPEVKF